MSGKALTRLAIAALLSLGAYGRNAMTSSEEMQVVHPKFRGASNPMIAELKKKVQKVSPTILATHSTAEWDKSWLGQELASCVTRDKMPANLMPVLVYNCDEKPPECAPSCTDLNIPQCMDACQLDGTCIELSKDPWTGVGIANGQAPLIDKPLPKICFLTGADPKDCVEEIHDLDGGCSN